MIFVQCDNEIKVRPLTLPLSPLGRGGRGYSVDVKFVQMFALDLLN